MSAPASDPLQTAFTRHAGVALPLICGAMYPCSNPELVAAVSQAGGLGVVQPLSLAYVHGRDVACGRSASSPTGRSASTPSSRPPPSATSSA